MVDDVMDEGGAVEEHPLVGVIVVGLCHLLTSVHIALPHLSIHNTLNLNVSNRHTISNCDSEYKLSPLSQWGVLLSIYSRSGFLGWPYITNI